MLPHLSPLDTTIRFTWRGFIVEIGADSRIRETASRIRYDVFKRERQHLDPRDTGREEDEFDAHYRHLVLSYAGTGEPVGACRLACSTATDRFYSASEFAIERFLELPGVKVELGRVCLRSPWRNNLALAALGRGVGAFLHQHQAEWAFGCSSVMTTDAGLAAALSAHFSHLAEGRTLDVRPHPQHAMPDLDTELKRLARHPVDEAAIDGHIPPLLRLYLRAGAALGAAPALDRDFGCIDFFTAVSLNDHRASILGRYVPC